MSELRAQVLVIALLCGLLLGVALAYLEVVRQERAFVDDIYGPRTADDGPAPADVSQLLEEAKRIIREATE